MSTTTLAPAAPARKARTRKPAAAAAPEPVAPALVQPPLSRALRSNVTLSIGVIAFPVSIHGAVNDDETGMTTICQHTGSEDHAGSAAAAVKLRKYCPVCDADHDFVSARKVDAGFVVVPKEVAEQADEAEVGAKDSIALKVHKATDVSGAMLTGKQYYISAKSAAAKASYAVVAALLAKRPDLVLMGEWAARSVASLYTVQANDGVLIMRQVARPELVRQRPEVGAPVDAGLVSALEQFVDATVVPYDALAYRSGRAQVMTEFFAKATPISAAEATDESGTASAGTDMSAQLANALAGLAQAGATPAKRRSRKAS